MRLTSNELAELILPYTQHFYDAIYAGCLAAGTVGLQRILDPDKKSIFSHIVRSEAFEYFLHNPLDDFTLDCDAHRLNQAIVLKHNSGLELRIMRLTSFIPPSNVPICGIDEDPAFSRTISQLDLQFQSPGVAAISWKTPTFINGEPDGEIPLILIRAAEGTKLRNGRADAIIPLYGRSNLIPESSFIPDLADSTFTFEDDDVQEH